MSIGRIGGGGPIEIPDEPPPAANAQVDEVRRPPPPLGYKQVYLGEDGQQYVLCVERRGVLALPAS